MRRKKNKTRKEGPGLVLCRWPTGRKGPVGLGKASWGLGLDPAAQGPFDQGDRRDGGDCHDEGPGASDAVGHQYCLLEVSSTSPIEGAKRTKAAAPSRCDLRQGSY